jgi:hypothetical protein
MENENKDENETFIQKREKKLFNPKLGSQKFVIEAITQVQIAFNVFAFCNFNELKSNKIYLTKVIFTVFALNMIVKNLLLVSLFRSEESQSIFSSLRLYHKFLFQDKTLYKINKSIPEEESILDSISYN